MELPSSPTILEHEQGKNNCEQVPPPIQLNRLDDDARWSPAKGRRTCLSPQLPSCMCSGIDFNIYSVAVTCDNTCASLEEKLSSPIPASSGSIAARVAATLGFLTNVCR
eukprot:m.113766 g.113766  ORF g.113766 m.113766 type:complete len:109 (+) comp13523_c0_seq8:941-1267(+)